MIKAFIIYVSKGPCNVVVTSVDSDTDPWLALLLCVCDFGQITCHLWSSVTSSLMEIVIG